MIRQQGQQPMDQLYFAGSAEPNPGGRMGAGWRLVYTDRLEETGASEWPAARDHTSNRAKHLVLNGTLTRVTGVRATWAACRCWTKGALVMKRTHLSSPLSRSELAHVVQGQQEEGCLHRARFAKEGRRCTSRWWNSWCGCSSLQSWASWGNGSLTGKAASVSWAPS